MIGDASTTHQPVPNNFYWDLSQCGWVQAHREPAVRGERSDEAQMVQTNSSHLLTPELAGR
jgi:hypothetical protein